MIIENDMSASYAANRPANIELRMDDFDRDFLPVIENAPQIAEVEPRRVFNIRARAANSQAWTTLDIVAIEDFDENQLNLLTPCKDSPNPPGAK